MSDSSNPDPIISNYVTATTTSSPFEDTLSKDTGVHFLTEQMHEPKQEGNKEGKEGSKGRHELLEYLLRTDGSVTCKMCGEVLQSRTHWYRHKYKRHAAQPTNPSPLFQCEQCFGYFKSRKGYIGHVASRHSELLSDTTPVLTNTHAEAVATDNLPQQPVVLEPKEEPDPELAIPKTTAPNYHTSVVKQASKATETKKTYYHRSKEQIVNQADWEEKRSREEKLVADIIDRVRRECEAQPAPIAPGRKGYTRRNTTVMHTLRQTDAMT